MKTRTLTILLDLSQRTPNGPPNTGVRLRNARCANAHAAPEATRGRFVSFNALLGGSLVIVVPKNLDTAKAAALERNDTSATPMSDLFRGGIP